MDTRVESPPVTKKLNNIIFTGDYYDDNNRNDIFNQNTLQEIFSEYLRSNFNNQKTSDITINIRDINTKIVKQTFYLHKFLLARSSYFLNAFSNNIYVETNTNTIDLCLFDQTNGFDQELFKFFFEFFYLVYNNDNIEVTNTSKNNNFFTGIHKINILNLHFLFNYIGFDLAKSFIETNFILNYLNIDNVLVCLNYYLTLNEWLLKSKNKNIQVDFLNNRIYFYCRQWIITFYNLFEKNIRKSGIHKSIFQDLENNAHQFNILNELPKDQIFLLDLNLFAQNNYIHSIKLPMKNTYLYILLNIRITKKRFFLNVIFKTYNRIEIKVNFTYICKIWNNKQILIESKSNNTNLSNECIPIININNEFFSYSFNDINIDLIKNNNILSTSSNIHKEKLNIIPLNFDIYDVVPSEIETYSSE